MRALCVFLIFLTGAGNGFGQESLTVTATRSLVLQPDEALIVVNATSGLNSGLDDVLAALSGSGITAVNLQTVYSTTSQQIEILNWTFTLAVPFSNLNAVLASLANVQRTLAQNRSGGINLIFNVQSSQASQQLLASQPCPISSLLSDARAQAQKIANSSGLIVGPILALSEANPPIPTPTPVATPVPAPVIPVSFNGGSTSGFAVALSASRVLVNTAPLTLPTSCSIAVKFAVALPQ